MPITITRKQLLALDPCDTQAARAIDLLWPGDDHPATAREAVDAGITLDDLVWVTSAVSQHDADIERRMHLWLADCAAHVLQHFEGLHPDDQRPRDAILTARLFARGEIDAAARDAARAAAWAAAWAARAAGAAAGAAARAAGAAAWAARDAAGAAEEAWQLNRLVLWLSDEEPDDWPLD